MASKLKESPTYFQAIDEFVFSNTLFTWKVTGFPSLEQLMEQDNGTIDLPKFSEKTYNGLYFEMSFKKRSENFFICLQYHKRYSAPYIPNKGYPYRLHVSVIDHNILVEEITVTKTISSQYPDPEFTPGAENLYCGIQAHLPKLQELLRTKEMGQTDITFDCCIQRLTHQGQAEQVVIEDQCSVLEALFLDKNRTDITLKCKDGDIQAHKFILMARWPAIADKMTSDSSAIDIADTRAEIAEKLLKFIYSGTCDEAELADEVTVKEVLYTADKYGLKELCKHLCNTLLSQKVSTENALEMYYLSRKHSSSYLKASALGEINLLTEMTNDPKILRVIYEESGLNNREERLNKLDFTWEIDCSGDFGELFYLPSKLFPFTPSSSSSAHLRIVKEESNYALYLHSSDDTGLLSQIWATVSITGTVIDSMTGYRNNHQGYKIMDMPNLSEKINNKNGNLKLVTISCRFDTFYDFIPVKPTAMNKAELFFYHMLTLTSQSKKGVGEDIYRCLQNKSGVDVKLIAKGEEFEAHKLILCARSSVFAAMFQSGLSEQLTNTVHISDIDGEVLTQLLKFIYTATTDDISDPTFTAQLLFAADKYDLQDLKALCEIQLCKEVTAENVLDMLLLAHQHSLTSLLKKALAKVRMNYEDLKDTAVYNAFLSENEDISLKIYTYLMSFLKLKQTVFGGKYCT